MTREEAKKALPLVQAFAEEQAIQYRIPGGEWKDIHGQIAEFELLKHPDRYRIKPDPREFALRLMKKDESGCVGLIYENEADARRFMLNDETIGKAIEVL